MQAYKAGKRPKGVKGAGKSTQTANTNCAGSPRTLQHSNRHCNPQQFSTAISSPMRQLELKPKLKPSKLLSSKSLSQLIPRNLFFKKNRGIEEADKSSNDVANKPHASGLTSTKSFPSYKLHTQSEQPMESTPELLVNRVNSISLIGLPRQSRGRSSFVNLACTDATQLEQPNLSPIGSPQKGPPFSFGGQQEPAAGRLEAAGGGNEEKDAGRKNEVAKGNKANKSTGNRYKALKSTTLVLRDVKNSLGLRMKARQESKAFTRFTNELATPPTSKLYSPFNIYSMDSNSSSPSNKQKPLKSRRNLNLNGSQSQERDQNPTDCSMDYSAEQTPKRRIALQHKRHLMQANKFNFDSPTGRLRETVKEVEHFQQCIEDISKAIKLRDQSS